MDLGPAFLWSVGLNSAYVIVEAAAGFLTGSLALLADDLHISALSTTRTALTVHVVVGAQDIDAVLHRLSEGLEHDFGIAHSTIQIEREPCSTRSAQAFA